MLIGRGKFWRDQYLSGKTSMRYMNIPTECSQGQLALLEFTSLTQPHQIYLYPISLI